MPDTRILGPGEIFLNGNKYRILDLKEEDSSIPPERQVFGDPTKVVDPYRSSVVFADWRGGIGQWTLDTPNPQKAWWSECQLRAKGHLLPQFAVTATNDLGSPNTSAIAGLIASDVTTSGTYLMYCAMGNVIYWLNSATWTLTTDGTNGYTIAGTPASVTDSYAGMLGSNRILVFAHSNGYAYKTSGAGTWANDTTQAVQYLAFWDDKLWMISSTGQLYYASTLGTETADALLALPAGSVTNLFVGSDASGEPILYVATTTGLWAHDFANSRFLKTALSLSYNANNGIGSCEWRGKIYFSSNMGVFEYDPRTGSIRSMGLDSDDGLRAKSRGVIKQLEPSLYELLALVDASGTTTGSSGVYGWDGIGWEAKISDMGDNAYAADYMHISSAVGSYRIWFAGKVIGSTRIVRYQPIPADRLPPEQIGSLFTFQNASHRHHTPWFTGGQDNVDKIALRAKIDPIFYGGGNGLLTIAYARDYSETTTDLWTNYVTSTGVGNRPAEANFTVGGEATGIAFRAIKFVVTLASNGADYVDLRSLTLEYLAIPRTKRRWQVILDMSHEFNGISVAQQYDNITTARSAQALVEFAWRDEAGTYVQVFKGTAPLITGHDKRSQIPLLLVEA